MSDTLPRLRLLAQNSAFISVEQVCRDAAAEIERLEEELKRAGDLVEGRDSWQPIETAPAAAPNQERILIVGGAWSKPEVVLPDGDWWRKRKSEGSSRAPTHWMPIPSFPSTEGK